MIRSFIERLGGTKAVAAQISELSGRPLNAKAVAEWARTDSVPQRWGFHVAKLAKKKKIKDIPAEIKGFLQ